jgi:hypothetical protein
MTMIRNPILPGFNPDPSICRRALRRGRAGGEPDANGQGRAAAGATRSPAPSLVCSPSILRAPGCPSTSDLSIMTAPMNLELDAD